MPRLRGTTIEKPEGEAAWPLLNPQLFGDAAVGGHHVAMRPEALPVDWAVVFGRNASIGLEIGFNRGAFLCAMAELHPDRDFVGIEVRRRFCWSLTNRLGVRPNAPRNVRLIWADAKAVCRAVFSPGTVSDVYISFPDPWWKARHAKRRLVDAGFVDVLGDLLCVGGAIWVKSDVPAIADEIAEALGAVSTLSVPEAFFQEDLPLTHRETKCVAQGLPITRFRVVRTT